MHRRANIQHESFEKRISQMSLNMNQICRFPAQMINVKRAYIYEMHYSDKRNHLGLHKLITIIFTKQSVGFDKGWRKWISEAFISFVFFKFFWTLARGLPPGLRVQDTSTYALLHKWAHTHFPATHLI